MLWGRGNNISIMLVLPFTTLMKSFLLILMFDRLPRIFTGDHYVTPNRDSLISFLKKPICVYNVCDCGCELEDNFSGLGSLLQPFEAGSLGVSSKCFFYLPSLLCL